MMTRTRLLPLLDLIFLIILGVFVVAGTPLATFHGDEPMQIYMSSDYETAFVQGNPSALMTQPPYPIDSDPHLRILNGTVNRYTIGFSRALAGIEADQLPPRPGWDWGLSYIDNVNTGHRPSDALMLAGRLPSSLFLAASVFVLFALARQFGNRPLAYFVTALYALNPIILLNGRRALQEGSLLFFGLLTIFTAAVIARRRANGKSAPLYLWIALILAGGLTLASKHTGVVFVAAALGWVFVGELTHYQLREAALTTAKLIVSGVLIAGLFIALSPALWNDPVARFGDLLAVRAEMLDIQVTADPVAPMTFEQRFESIITQPFLAPLAHYETNSWVGVEPIEAEQARYMTSPLSGLQFGNWLGLALTALAGIGIVALFVPSARPNREWASSLGMVVWLGVTAASLLANPLPWQRYYLPLIPMVTLLSGIGLMALARAFVVRYRPDARLQADTH
jgi:4-amino-4-deoxy-L-arabinose transferase-like glycosyltransferase